MTSPANERFVWKWTLHAEDGTDVDVEGYDDVFDSQSDAESWIGEVYPDLLDRGVVAGTLMEGERAVYRMGLEGEG